MKYPLANAALVAIVTIASSQAQAVMLLQNEPRNLTAPTGSLANSGWQYQGSFNVFLGTPISSKYFLTAQHIGSIENGMGQPFFYDGSVFHTDQAIDVPGTDLRLWRIEEKFNSWATIYNREIDGPEAGKDMVVFGRGTQRGDPILVSSPSTPPGNSSVPVRLEQKGWYWGAGDGLQSWGQNRIDFLVSDPDVGDLLYFGFDNPGMENESALSDGDSGGAVFIRGASGQWKLAGINFAVDGPFRLSPAESEFRAALFDVGGLYRTDPPMRIPDLRENIASGAYASAVSSSLPFISYVINTTESAAAVPEPTTAAVLSVAGASCLLGRRRSRA